MIAGFVEELPDTDLGGAPDELGRGVIGQKNDLDRGAVGHRGDRFGDLEPVAVLELQIDDDEVGPQPADRFDRDGYRICRAGDFDVPRVGEQFAEDLRELR